MQFQSQSVFTFADLPSSSIRWLQLWGLRDEALRLLFCGPLPHHGDDGEEQEFTNNNTKLNNARTARRDLLQRSCSSSKQLPLEMLVEPSTRWMRVSPWTWEGHMLGMMRRTMTDRWFQV